MNSQRIATLLDRSCAEALDVWCQERRISPPEASNAMQELDKLINLQRPDYGSEYIPPAYVIRYQLGHVYMAWKALSYLESAHWRRDSLRIIDFGAGASAGRIGAALMAAQAIEDGRIDSIYYDEIDTSAPMQEMGELIWQAFTNEVRHKFANTSLARAVEVIDYSQHMDWKNVAKRDCETWLTTFHAIYQDDNGLKGEFDRLTQHVNPTFGVFSCNRSNLGFMRYVSPFCEVHLLEPESGYFPHHEGEADGKCPTGHIIGCAVKYGFRTQDELYMRPFLQVKNCVISFGIPREESNQQISEAKAEGELRENTSFGEAKNAQAYVEGRIQELKDKIHQPHIIDDSQIPDDQVALGRRVVIRENGYDHEEVYTIVGSTETDPSNGRISNESPIGKALIGRTSGEVVRVEAPAGEIEFEIVRVECVLAQTERGDEQRADQEQVL